MNKNLTDESLELIDPNPNIHELFVLFNDLFFNGRLGSVEVKWSARMTLCAGLCRYVGRNGQCSIHLSKPLLSLRPRRDLIETLLHEMIHAYLFVVDKNKERESHGPKFIEIMNSINMEANTKITVYHSFHGEVAYLKVHWWQCNGPCKSRPPYYGLVKRSMNRAPGPNDFWYADHKKACTGSFVKIKEPVKPAPKTKVSRKRKAEQSGLIKISDVFAKVPCRNGVSKPDTVSVPPNLENGSNATKTGSEEIAATPKLKYSDANATFSSSGVLAFSGKGYVLGTGNSSSSRRPPLRENHPLVLKWESNRKMCDKKNLDGSQNEVTTPQIPGSSKEIKTEDTTDEKMGSLVIDLDQVKVDEVIDISSDDEEMRDESSQYCPACGIDYPSFLQTLEEHLQMCEILLDMDT